MDSNRLGHTHIPGEQQNADTGVFSQGDFCRIGALQDYLDLAGIGPPNAAKYCHQFSDVKLCILKRNTVVILRSRAPGQGKEGKRSP